MILTYLGVSLHYLNTNAILSVAHYRYRKIFINFIKSLRTKRTRKLIAVQRTLTQTQKQSRRHRCDVQRNAVVADILRRSLWQHACHARQKKATTKTRKNVSESARKTHCSLYSSSCTACYCPMVMIMDGLAYVF